MLFAMMSLSTQYWQTIVSVLVYRLLLLFYYILQEESKKTLILYIGHVERYQFDVLLAFFLF